MVTITCMLRKCCVARVDILHRISIDFSWNDISVVFAMFAIFDRFLSSILFLWENVFRRVPVVCLASAESEFVETLEAQRLCVYCDKWQLNFNSEETFSWHLDFISSVKEDIGEEYVFILNIYWKHLLIFMMCQLFMLLFLYLSCPFVLIDNLNIYYFFNSLKGFA